MNKALLGIGIVISFCIYLIHKIANIFVFWASFPKYIDWIKKNEQVYSGLFIVAILGGYLVHWIVCLLFVSLYFVWKWKGIKSRKKVVIKESRRMRRLRLRKTK